MVQFDDEDVRSLVNSLIALPPQLTDEGHLGVLKLCRRLVKHHQLFESEARGLIKVLETLRKYICENFIFNVLLFC